MSSVYSPVRAQCTQCSRPSARKPVSSNPATGLAEAGTRPETYNTARKRQTPAASVIWTTEFPGEPRVFLGTACAGHPG